MSRMMVERVLSIVLLLLVKTIIVFAFVGIFEVGILFFNSCTFSLTDVRLMLRY
jgi:hypothetical protein